MNNLVCLRNANQLIVICRVKYRLEDKQGAGNDRMAKSLYTETGVPISIMIGCYKPLPDKQIGHCCNINYSLP